VIAWLFVIGVALLWVVALGVIANWWERRESRQLNARFRENQRLWRHG
jgi:hypothetical protein